MHTYIYIYIYSGRPRAPVAPATRGRSASRSPRGGGPSERRSALKQRMPASAKKHPSGASGQEDWWEKKL